MKYNEGDEEKLSGDDLSRYRDALKARNYRRQVKEVTAKKAELKAESETEDSK